MQNQVNIVADDMGNVIRQSQSNPEYGYVRLQQNRVTIGANSWVKNSNRSTLLLGKLEDLQALDLKANQTLPGKIIVKESVEPFSGNDPDRDLKYAGDTGIICAVDGQPIYRKSFFTADVYAEDVLVAHDNGHAIREANGMDTKVKAKSQATPAEAFGITEEEVAEAKEEDNEDVIEDTDNKEELVEEEAETFEL
tara:strand:+ start:879 stop:1463 length:585 start_codon:yes stop_codon:yes gene_type:complete